MDDFMKVLFSLFGIYLIVDGIVSYKTRKARVKDWGLKFLVKDWDLKYKVISGDTAKYIGIFKLVTGILLTIVAVLYIFDVGN